MAHIEDRIVIRIFHASKIIKGLYPLRIRTMAVEIAWMHMQFRTDNIQEDKKPVERGETNKATTLNLDKPILQEVTQQVFLEEELEIRSTQTTTKETAAAEKENTTSNSEASR